MGDRQVYRTSLEQPRGSRLDILGQVGAAAPHWAPRFPLCPAGKGETGKGKREKLPTSTAERQEDRAEANSPRPHGGRTLY